MAKKKTNPTNDIITAYMHYVLEHNETPKSVYVFAKDNNLTEDNFYDHFGSFEAVEKSIWKTFVSNTIELLNKSEGYAGFDAKNKLLSFYYTFFEILKANRSYVVYALNQHKNKLQTLALVSSIKQSFVEYIEDIEIETVDLKENNLEKIKERSLKELAWSQLLFTLKFWLEDDSPGFDKTDIFIEKSVTASFDLIDVTALKSVFDFGKFIFKEKVNTGN